MEAASKPFPSYEELSERISERLDLDAEFSESNYEVCKYVHDNIQDPANDEEILRKMKQIVSAGGQHAFMKITEILCDFAEMSQEKRLRLFLFFRLHSHKIIECF
jgi:hypothetical protein